MTYSGTHVSADCIVKMHSSRVGGRKVDDTEIGLAFLLKTCRVIVTSVSMQISQKANVPKAIYDESVNNH